MAQQPTGFIGIGIMGEGMAGCLLKAGKTLVVWNRDASKAQKLSKAYPGLVTVVSSAGEVIDACAVTYSMLSTLEASEAVFPSILKSIKQGKSLVDCATLTPERMQTMASAVEIAQGRFLEAPVSGSKAPAAQGALIFLCGGDKSLYDECKNDLAIMGKADFYYGSTGAGSKMKLVVNMVMGNMMSDLGVPLCRDAFTPSTRLVSISRWRGWSLFRFGGHSMLRAGARSARASRCARPPSCRRTPTVGCSRCWTWASCRTASSSSRARRCSRATTPPISRRRPRLNPHDTA
jgi:hypothetical protein